MSMTNTDPGTNNNSAGFDDFIKAQVNIVCELNEKRVNEMRGYSKAFLDKIFPLDEGSHQDVSSYVIYYKHLLAFFPDGRKSGLKHPKQFVALSGHKIEPTSIVLKNDGFHVELMFNKKGTRGIKDIAGIDDIQVETTIVDVKASNDETVDVLATQSSQARRWFSMLRSDDDLVYNASGSQV